MPDAITEFFERLSDRPIPFADLPPKIKGIIRIDLHSGETTEHWYLRLSEGEAFASRTENKPNTVLGGPRSSFERIIRGEAQLFASWNRNETTVEGDSALAVYLTRLLPNSPGAHDPRSAIRRGRPTA